MDEHKDEDEDQEKEEEEKEEEENNEDENRDESDEEESFLDVPESLTVEKGMFSFTSIPFYFYLSSC